MKKTQRSQCCKAKVRVDGIPDFLGIKEICTVSYICLKCKKSCNVVALKGQKRRILTTKKRIREGKKRLDFQGRMLKMLGELFDGITIHPIKGVILTAKKKRQLVELLKMEQKLSKSKIKKPRV